MTVEKRAAVTDFENGLFKTFPNLLPKSFCIVYAGHDKQYQRLIFCDANESTRAKINVELKRFAEYPFLNLVAIVRVKTIK